ncbi:MAG TPA: DUF922 domain-containing protein [Luteimonas sp.]|nr:DUF922 domain-containing protein [Luteimonas sp.]
MTPRIAVALALIVGCLANGRAQASEPQLIVEESTVYYPVYGRDRLELMRSLRVPGGSGNAHGLTRSEFRLETEFVQDRGRCIVRRLVIRLDVRIDLPRWDDAAPIPAELRDDWRIVSERTARHEALHRQNALDAVEDLRQTLRRRPPDDACADLTRAIRRETNRVRARWQLRDNLLDQRDILRLPARRR